MVRFARERDFDFVKQSWTVCFDDPPEFVDWNFNFNYAPENTVLAEDNGSPASVMQLMPYTLVLNGAEIHARYVSGVATMPEYRGRGLARKLFNFGLPAMYNMGCGISILVPAVSGMYEKFGYCTVAERTSYTAGNLGSGKRITEWGSDIISILDTLYLSEMSAKSAYIKRSRLDWKHILTDLLSLSHGCIILNESNRKPCGYALAYPKDGGFEICEICGKTDIQISACRIPPVMARIVNVQNVLRRFPGLFENGTKLRITDRFIPENNGCFLIDGGEVCPCTESGLTLDTAALTSMLFAGCAENGTYINLLL